MPIRRRIIWALWTLPEFRSPNRVNNATPPILCLTFALNGASKGAQRRLRASVFERVVRRHHFHHVGYVENFGMSSSAQAQVARDCQKMRACGEMVGELSREPAGTTTVRPLRV